VRELRGEVVRLAADLEARVDFADETEMEGIDARLADDHRRLRREVAALAESYAQGRRLGGVAVAFTGAVNAGKSSLFNALLGERRALVSQQRGTTRDYLEAEVQWDGLRVVLVDTAGQRVGASASALERAGQALGRARVARCDLAVEVVDLSLLPRDRRPGWSEAPALVAANKRDLLGDEEVRARCAAIAAAGAGQVVAVSAEQGTGLDDLRQAMLAALFGEGSATLEQTAETVQVTQARQHEALRRAEAALAAGEAALERGLAPELVVEHTREALGALGEITGETFTEDVLDAVFSRFCIGK
jgi:tRNA modification GTPase